MSAFAFKACSLYRSPPGPAASMASSGSILGLENGSELAAGAWGAPAGERRGSVLLQALMQVDPIRRTVRNCGGFIKLPLALNFGLDLLGVFNQAPNFPCIAFDVRECTSACWSFLLCLQRHRQVLYTSLGFPFPYRSR